ncbi:MAG: twin-arginine translocase subunit TatC [Leptospirillum sp.]
MKKDMADEIKSSPFWGHIVELRKRVLRSLLWVFVLMGASFPFADKALAYLGREAGVPLVFTAPTEAFWVTLKISLFMGTVLAYPFVLYEIWAFVSPGLFRREKRNFMVWVLGGTLFFMGGVSFSNFIALPAALHFLVGFGEREGLKAFMGVDRTVAFELRFLFVFGLIFELPLLMALSSARGWITPDKFRKGRRWALVGNAIAASVLSPTQDFLNMMIMFVPLVILYEAGILLSMWTYSRHRTVSPAVSPPTRVAS